MKLSKSQLCLRGRSVGQLPGSLQLHSISLHTHHTALHMRTITRSKEKLQKQLLTPNCRPHMASSALHAQEMLRRELGQPVGLGTCRAGQQNRKSEVELGLLGLARPSGGSEKRQQGRVCVQEEVRGSWVPLHGEAKPGGLSQGAPNPVCPTISHGSYSAARFCSSWGSSTLQHVLPRKPELARRGADRACPLFLPGPV